MGASDLYRSWPAVSQISNLTVVFSSRDMVWVRKAAPMVDSRYESNWSLTNLRTIELWIRLMALVSCI